jgi:hypothetical protein
MAGKVAWIYELIENPENEVAETNEPSSNVRVINTG